MVITTKNIVERLLRFVLQRGSSYGRDCIQLHVWPAHES